MTSALYLSEIPVVDQHGHPWLRPSAIHGPSPDSYRLFFTEGIDPRLAADIPTSVHYRWMLRELSRVLECAADEAAVLDARAARGHDAFAARLMAEARIEHAILDDRYAGRGTATFSVAEMSAQLGGAATTAALRLESVLEDLVLDADDPGEVEDRFRSRLDRPRLAAEGVVALKSIIAYRAGLDVAPTSRAAAYAAFPALKAEATASGRVRIADKRFLDYFLLLALDWAAAERFPVQIHTGFGDPDLSLPGANPVLLRHVLQDGRYAGAPLVLLHAGWPYVRELSYLASVYPDVCLDVGLAIPFAATEGDEIIRQALALAPATKVLYSSDGFSIPEHCWFAALQGRRAIGRVLGELLDRGAIAEADAWETADLILRANARRLYGLAAPASPSLDLDPSP